MRAQAIFSCCVQESSAGTEHVGLAGDGACASALVGAASNVKTAMSRKQGRMENRPGSKGGSHFRIMLCLREPTTNCTADWAQILVIELDPRDPLQRFEDGQSASITKLIVGISAILIVAALLGGGFYWYLSKRPNYAPVYANLGIASLPTTVELQPQVSEST